MGMSFTDMGHKALGAGERYTAYTVPGDTDSIAMELQLSNFSNIGTVWGAQTYFDDPFGVVQGASGKIYVADNDNDRIRVIGIDGIVTTLCTITEPRDIVVKANESKLFVTSGDNKVYQVALPGGTPTVLAGSGSGAETDDTGVAAAFTSPKGLALNPANEDYLYVVTSHRVRRVVVSTGVVTTLAGSSTGAAVDNTGASAVFNDPVSITVDSTGTNAYIGEDGNASAAAGLRKMVIGSGVVTTLDSISSTEKICGVAVDKDDKFIWYLIYKSSGSPGYGLYRYELATSDEHFFTMATSTTLAASSGWLVTDSVGLKFNNSNNGFMHLTSSGCFLVTDQYDRVMMFTPEAKLVHVAGVNGTTTENPNGTIPNLTIYANVHFVKSGDSIDNTNLAYSYLRLDPGETVQIPLATTLPTATKIVVDALGAGLMVKVSGQEKA